MIRLLRYCFGLEDEAPVACELHPECFQEFREREERNLPAVYLVPRKDWTEFIRSTGGMVVELRPDRAGSAEFYRYFQGVPGDAGLRDWSHTLAPKMKQSIRALLKRVGRNRKQAFIVGVADLLFEELAGGAIRPQGASAEVQEEPPGLRERFRGDAKSAKLVRQAIVKLAHDSTFDTRTVLITGPSGTGKEIVARCIHDLSVSRRKGGWVPVNCSAIMETLFESEMFGIGDKVASQVKERIGLWEAAQDGTLFLDEVGDLPLGQQAKLLRALEAREVRLVGERVARPMTARVIAATHWDLKQLVREGRFREDLFYRLHGVEIRTEALSDQPELISELARVHWARLWGERPSRLSREIMSFLRLLPWPGNVRQLLAFLDRLRFDHAEEPCPSEELVQRCWRRFCGLDEGGTEEEDAARALAPEPRSSPLRKTDLSRLDAAMRDYRKSLPTYQHLAMVLDEILHRAARTHAPLATVSTRVKSAASLAEKILRSPSRRGRTLGDVHDVCSGEVLVLTAAEVGALGRLIESTFNKRSSLPVRVKGGGPKASGGCTALCVEVLMNGRAAEQVERLLGVQVPREVLGCWATLTVLTLVEHAWLRSGRLPERGEEAAGSPAWEARRRMVGNALDAAERALSELHGNLSRHELSWREASDREGLERDLATVLEVLKYDPENVGQAALAGKLALALGKMDEAIRVMGPLQESGYPPLLRDLGVALTKKHRGDVCSEGYQAGHEYLREACEAAPTDVDALSAYGGSLVRLDRLEEGFDWYLRAHRQDPYASYPLLNLIALAASRPELARNDVMAELVSCCESAVERCEEQERERLNLPWACYDLSRLNLVLGRYREAVETAHRAVRESSAEWMIETSLGGVDRIASYQKSEEWNKGVEEARRVLADGLAALAAARAPEEGA